MYLTQEQREGGDLNTQTRTPWFFGRPSFQAYDMPEFAQTKEDSCDVAGSARSAHVFRRREKALPLSSAACACRVRRFVFSRFLGGSNFFTA